ncbi:TPA: TraI domain-containing protein [Escherichia coli]|uniref:TraI domain-containing protein n=1 Tax=Enterobacteriaceae TaxID=543 RepID=UPI0005FD0D47|nr:MULTISPECIES: TraI domain-containing protein [Enterobacteriaceae]EEF1092854.1 heavy metal resistance protein CzcA [Salmonella enterica subsp. enterica serovar Typhi]HAD6372789.1 heavy metal resistance protein CzcA [Salmonella enterica subsp. enterica serovar Typhi str. CT18]HCM9019721.1 TraI domain-containing protein [Salmonella enterica subsp. enterica serovar Paratyphi B]MBC9315619.1 TraI domain-containing protein [Escherichia coli]MCJ8672348.1 TraI domain-containing protein [Escherichia 
MLNRLKKLLPGNSNTRSAETTDPEVVRQPEHLPEGFYIPRTAEELTFTPRRKQCLKQLWENSSMPSDVYQQFCLTPVQKLLMAAQNVPAARDSRWADANGFGDLTLQFTTCAVRLARGYMFPPGATPEEQAAQSGVWNAVVFWSALFYHLPLLANLEGELVSGKLWQPGMSSPDEAFRFRYRQQHLQGTEAQQLAAVMAGQLLPEGTTAWLATVPGALQNLAGAVWHQHPEMALIRSVLKTAAEEVESPLLASPVTEPVTAPLPSETTVQSEGNVPSESQTETSTEAIAPEMPAVVTEVGEFTLQPSVSGTGEAEAVVPDTLQSATDAEEKSPEEQNLHDDTDMLLSLFSAVSDDTELTEADAMESVENKKTIFDESGCANSEQAGAESDPAQVTGILGSVLCTSEPTQEIKKSPEHSQDRNSTENVRVPGSSGEFVEWLRHGLDSGEIPVNQPDARVHLIAGYAFLRVPDVFYLYLKQTGSNHDRRYVQSVFERAGLHRVRSGERFVQARLYGSAERKGRYQPVSGYLVKSRSLFSGKGLPGDSPFIAFP